MFIDTSAVIAILAREPDAAYFANKIEHAARPISAGHVLLEASVRLSSTVRVESEVAKNAVLQLLEEASVAFVSIDIAVADSAVSAFARFGRGRGGKAQLNFGDCLSYACANVHGTSLLFKGDDFAATDARRA